MQNQDNKKDEIAEVKADKVACDGSLNGESHPINYINLKSGEIHTCIYCGQKFIKK